MNEAWNILSDETRKHKISKISEGDLIKLKSDIFPLIYHYGIVINDQDKRFVYHNTPNLLNRNNGNIVKEPLDDWLKLRDISSIEPTGLKSDEIHNIVKVVYGKKYNFLNFNCEHFTSYVKEKKYISSQVAQWSIIIATLSITYLIYRKTK